MTESQATLQDVTIFAMDEITSFKDTSIKTWNTMQSMLDTINDFKFKLLARGMDGHDVTQEGMAQEHVDELYPGNID